MSLSKKENEDPHLTSEKKGDTLNAREEGEDTGFSLVELMTIVAILGSLLAIVLVSMSGSRAKAADKAIASSLMGIQLRAAALYEENGCYSSSSVCRPTASGRHYCTGTETDTLFSDPKIVEFLTAAGKYSNGTGIGRATCVSSAGQTAWAISVPLKSNAGKHFCVDSKKAAREVTLNTESVLPFVEIAEAALMPGNGIIPGSAECNPAP